MYLRALRGRGVKPGGGGGGEGWEGGSSQGQGQGSVMGRRCAIKDSSPTPAAPQVSCPQVTRLGSEAGKGRAISSYQGWSEGAGKDCRPRGTRSLGFRAHQLGEGTLGEVRASGTPLEAANEKCQRDLVEHFLGARSLFFLSLSTEIQSTGPAGLHPASLEVKAVLPLSCWHLFGGVHTYFTRFILYPMWGLKNRS